MAETGRSFNLNRPEASAKDEYLYLWQQYELNLANLICTSDAKFDPRIPRMVRFMISLIAHDNIRYSSEQRFDAAIRYANNRKDLTLDERNDMILRICATMSGNLTAYIDQFKGLAHQLKIGELVDMSKKYYQDSLHPEQVLEGGDEDDIVLTKEMIILVKGGQILSPLHIENDEEPGFVCTMNNDEGEHVADDAAANE